MASVEKLSVALNPDMVAEMHSAVKIGDSGSVSEVVREALRDWRLRRKIDALETEELRRLVQEGIDSGPGLDAALVFAGRSPGSVRLRPMSGSPAAPVTPSAADLEEIPTTSPGTILPGQQVLSPNSKRSAARLPQRQSFTRPHRSGSGAADGAHGRYLVLFRDLRTRTRGGLNVFCTAPQPAATRSIGTQLERAC